jgi:hypothetical protein
MVRSELLKIASKLEITHRTFLVKVFNHFVRFERGKNRATGRLKYRRIGKYRLETCLSS